MCVDLDLAGHAHGGRFAVEGEPGGGAAGERVHLTKERCRIFNRLLPHKPSLSFHIGSICQKINVTTLLQWDPEAGWVGHNPDPLRAQIWSRWFSYLVGTNRILDAAEVLFLQSVFITGKSKLKECLRHEAVKSWVLFPTTSPAVCTLNI